MQDAASPIFLALGEIVRARREMLQISQAGVSGLHRNVVGQIERGRVEPTLSVLVRLAHGLDMKASELLAAAEARLEELSTD